MEKGKSEVESGGLKRYWEKAGEGSYAMLLEKTTQ